MTTAPVDRQEPVLTEVLGAAPDAVPMPPGLADDGLAQALVWLTAHHGRARTLAGLFAGQPVTAPLGPDQALRALRDAGFNAALLPRRLGDLHALLMPAVLLLKSGDAAIVTRRLEGGRYEVVLPASGHAVVQAAEAELAPECTGFVLLCSPQAAMTESQRQDSALRDPDSHWLWGTLRRFMPYYRSAMLAALISNVLMLASSLVTSVVFDKGIPHSAFVTLWTLATGALLALLFDLAARQLRSHLIDVAGRKADLLIGSILFRQTLSVRMEHRPESAGSYAHVLAQVEVVRDFFASATLAALSDLPFVILFVGMTFVIGGPLGWVLALSVPVIIGLAALIQGALRRAMSSNLHQQADLQGVLVEAVEGLEDLKAAGAQGRFVQRYEEATAAAAAASLRARHLSAWANNIAMAAQQFVTLAMLVWGVYLVDAGHITGGALIGAVMLAGRAIAPLGSVVSLATRYQGARAAMRSLDKLMSQPVERDVERPYVPMPQLQGALALREVGFTYPPTPGASNSPAVLKGINLALPPGSRVAILGRIGSGKSTVLRLLAGLYQPTEGRVEVDGLDLRQLDPADYRTRVGFVSQEPRLFQGTLRDNVLMGRAAADARRLSEVAALTGLDRLVASHPLGWDLPVGEMGGLLSGGQRQLVALARCLVTRPRVLLMDEPTSSMDAQSEVAFLRHLHTATQGCTLVMVTHRPAVLELVQRVVVVDAGKIVVDGPTAQVMAYLAGQKPGSVPAAAAPAAATPSAASAMPVAPAAPEMPVTPGAATHRAAPPPAATPPPVSRAPEDLAPPPDGAEAGEEPEISLDLGEPQPEARAA